MNEKKREHDVAKEQGCVYLVGAGPGDPDLLTVKALRLLQSVDVVVYDRLVSDRILALIPNGTTRIFAGKAARNHHMPQDQTNKLLLAVAQGGRNVVRLKGGDPFVFGRGSEEALYLQRHNVRFEVVPGISASAGCSAYAGIPLTHRGLATSVRFVTGHCKAGTDLNLNWASLADPDSTLVIYMGLTNLDRIVAELTAHGLAPDRPAAAIQNGTTPDQRTLVTTLAELPRRIVEEEFEAPTLIVIGPVVDLAECLGHWAPLAAAAG